MRRLAITLVRQTPIAEGTCSNNSAIQTTVVNYKDLFLARLNSWRKPPKRQMLVTDGNFASTSDHHHVRLRNVTIRILEPNG